MPIMSQINVSNYAAQKYNVSGAVDGETARKYLTVLMAVAGADGELAPEELAWLINEQRAIGAPEELLSEIPKLEWRGAKVDALLEQVKYTFSVNTRRTLLYQAIKMSRADHNYHQKERSAVERMGQALGVEFSVVDAIHALVDLEQTADRLRHGLLETSRNTQ